VRRHQGSQSRIRTAQNTSAARVLRTVVRPRKGHPMLSWTRWKRHHRWQISCSSKRLS